MSNIVIDHSRADMERRMRLLEMAGGNLDRAIVLERWVQFGFIGKTQVTDSPGGPVIVDNPGGDHVARPELPTSETQIDDDAPAGALKAGSRSEGDSHECGRLTSEPEVARVAPPVTGPNADGMEIPPFLRRERASA